jgi:hemoglobin-like flavoprotein
MPFRWPWQAKPEPPRRSDPKTAWRTPLVAPGGSAAVDITAHNRAVLADRLTKHLANLRETNREDSAVTDTYDPATEDQSAPTRHAAADADTERISLADDCPHCMGTGHVLTTNDYLRMSIQLLGDQGDKVVAEFYARLLTEAPELASLFPDDLVDPLAGAASPGRIQRDKLLGALVAVSQTYDRTDLSAMEILDTHLATFGRAHANFHRPDGSVRGATLAEYHAVKVVLFGTLHDAAGEAWRPEYDDAWSEAYDYAVGEMMHAQNHTDQKAARYPRPSR